MAEKEVIFESVFEMAGDFEDKEAEEISEVQRDEVDRLTQKFVARTKEAYSKLMGMELVLVTQTEQVIKQATVDDAAGLHNLTY